MALTELEYVDLPGTLPASSELAPGQALRLQSSSARFDGSGAAAAFLPCLALYSQDGKLIGRWPTAQAINPGDSGEVTFGPFLDDGQGGAPRAAYLQGPSFIDVGAGVLDVPVTWETLQVSAPACIATGDAATQTIQNQAGDDAIFFLQDGLYLLGTLTQIATVPTPVPTDVRFSGTADIIPSNGAISTDFGGTQPPFVSWTPIYARNAWGAGTTPPPYTQLLLSNGSAGTCRFQFMTIAVGFVPGFVPEMATVY